jgi:iron complex transport system ATP-binding protein
MLLEAHQVTAGYGECTVLQAVDIDVSPGEFVGLIGPNGCGKSTLLRAISGVLRPKSGTVSIGGRALERLPARDVALALAFVPQSERVAFDFTVHDVVLMGRHPHHRRGQGWTKRDFDRVRWALAASDILSLADRSITRLSGGEHRRVLLARALAQDAPLLLLDEPTAHLDITHQVELLGLVRRLTRSPDAPIGALAALHDLNQAAEFCDRLVLMQAGRVIVAGQPDEVLTAAYLKQVYSAEAQIGRNPVTGRPAILALTPSRDAASRTDAPCVHLVCGGGSGVGILGALVRSGCNVSTGVLNRLDTDQEAAEALGIEAALEAPYSAFTADACAHARRLMARADVILVAPVPFGHGNLVNLELVVEAQEMGKPVMLLGDDRFAARDYVGGAAVTLFDTLLARGAHRYERVEDWPLFTTDVQDVPAGDVTVEI